MKTRIIRLALAAVALAAPAMTNTAHADVAVAQGLGTISPGVPVQGCAVGARFHIEGSAVNLGTTYDAGPYNFVVDGASAAACPSFTSDFGTADITGDVTGTLNYTRTVGLIQLNGFARVGSNPTVPISMTCHVAILSAEPVTSFAVVCAVTI